MTGEALVGEEAIEPPVASSGVGAEILGNKDNSEQRRALGNNAHTGRAKPVTSGKKEND